MHSRRRLLFFRAPLSNIARVAPRLGPSERYESRLYSLEEIRATDDAVLGVEKVLKESLVDALPSNEVILVRINGEVAGWILVHVGACRWPLTETDTHIDVPPTDGVWTSAYTRPEFRGRGIHPALLGACADRSLERGATHALAWTEDTNVPSKRNIERAGLVMIGSHERAWFFGRPTAPSIQMSDPQFASV